MKKKIKLFFLVMVLYKSLYSLRSNEILVEIQWDKSVYYQGENGRATIEINSYCPDDLKITWVGIHFEWLEKDRYFAKNLEDRPILLSPYGSAKITVNFSIPKNAKVGLNEYKVRIYCTQYRGYGPTSEVWDSEYDNIYIHDMYEKEYDSLYSLIVSKIAEAENYENLEAKRLVAKAKIEYESAVSAAENERWEYAVSCLRNAYNFLAEAAVIEEHERAKREIEEYEKSEKEGTFNFYLIGIISLFLLLVVLVVIIRFKSKLRPKSTQT